MFAVCRRVDMAGPLQRLKQKFFTVEGNEDANGFVLFFWIVQGAV